MESEDIRVALPHERLSLEIAHADLIYVAAALGNAEWDVGGARRWPFLQYAALVAFETKKHYRAVWDIELEAAWDETTATRARMSAKYLDDNRRTISDTRAYFAEMLASNHGAFFPPDRLGEEFDFLRDDLSVASTNGTPLGTNVGGHFIAGFDPQTSGDWAAAKTHAFDLSRGIGNIARQVVGDELDDASTHRLAIASPAIWWDGKSAEFLPQLFAGEFDEALTMALMTLIATARAVNDAARPVCCGNCRFAALKHRFVVLYQTARSLEILSNEDHTGRPETLEFFGTLFSDKLVSRILERRFKALRNGLVHLGLGDVADQVALDASANGLIGAYTGLTGQDFENLVDQSLSSLLDLAMEFLVTSRIGGNGLFSVMHPAPTDE